MKRMVSKNLVKKNREKKRLRKLEEEGRLVRGVEIPQGALPADPDKQIDTGGLSKKLFYRDIEYRCAGCGKAGVWTDEQQKRYFEEQGGNIYNEPKWCAECHRKRMAEKRGEKPQP